MENFIGIIAIYSADFQQVKTKKGGCKNTLPFLIFFAKISNLIIH